MSRVSMPDNRARFVRNELRRKTGKRTTQEAVREGIAKGIINGREGDAILASKQSKVSNVVIDRLYAKWRIGE